MLRKMTGDVASSSCSISLINVVFVDQDVTDLCSSVGLIAV